MDVVWCGIDSVVGIKLFLMSECVAFLISLGRIWLNAIPSAVSFPGSIFTLKIYFILTAYPRNVLEPWSILAVSSSYGWNIARQCQSNEIQQGILFHLRCSSNISSGMNHLSIMQYGWSSVFLALDLFLTYNLSWIHIYLHNLFSY